MKFEYRVEQRVDTLVEEAMLDELGEAGWELVTVVYHEYLWHYYLRRERPSLSSEV